MHKRVIILLFFIKSLIPACIGQQPEYTPKHFVVEYDTSEFKPIRPPTDGFSRIYHQLERPEIWDVADNNTTQVTGWSPALICIEGNYRNGKKNGIFKTYLIDSFDHSKRYKIWEQTYVNDKLSGQWRMYFLNGVLVKITTYKSDSLNGLYRKYWIDGKTIEEEREYFNGSNTFIIRTYFKSGNLERESPYKNGMLNGTAKSYYENGNLQEILPIVNDKENGLVRRYYENGNSMEEINMRNGLFHGIRKYYHPNVKIWSIE